MTDNEKLIEEAAKAIMEASHGEGEWEFREPMEEELYLRRARAALAVFEKAHTPSDDEREALEEALRYLDALNADRQIWYDDYSKLHDLVSAGFRRSEVAPEPSAEDFRKQIADERARQIDDGYDIIHDRVHGVDHLLGWAQDYARRGRTVQAAALVEAARELIAKSLEPQGEPSDASECEHCGGETWHHTVECFTGEPSDAQVLAALDAFFPGSSTSLSEFGRVSVEGMRAALRAAGDVR